MALLAKNLLFTLVVPGTVGVYLPLLLAREREPSSGPFLVAAAVLLLCGTLVYAWCVWDFASFGRGTPAPIDAPKRLVVRGLYRYTRNPMYVGVLCVVFGIATLYRAPALLLYAFTLIAGFNLFVRLYEEPHLAAEFGDEYANYCRRVGRWLPRPRRSAA